MNTQSIAGRMAEWVASLQYEQLPRRVVEEAKNQVLSVIAATHSGHFSEPGRIVTRTMKEWSSGREATLIPTGERASVADALFVNAALSMALDYDDYLFAGHTGHSAVLASLAVAEKAGASGRDVLLAQVAANEIEGRLGAAVLFGPLNGQMWSFLHLIGGAVAAAKLMRLDAAQIENAIGIAMAHPNFGLQPGFFGSEGKVLYAATTVPMGVRAAELAANGMRGATAIFEGDNGFLRHFTRQPLLGAFEGYGTAWLTDTLCFKIYPGCAYIDTAVDCALQIARQHHINAAAISAVHVAATPLTLGMEAYSAPYLKGPESLPTTLNFSLKYSLAAALTDRELTARQFLRERIKDPALWQLVDKVHLTLDDEMSRRMRDNALVKISYANGQERPALDLSAAELNRFRTSFGARLRIEMQDGRRFEMEQEVPLGAAGRPFDERRRVVEDKFRRETRYTLRKERMEKAIDLVHHLDEANSAQVRDLIRSSCSERD